MTQGRHSEFNQETADYICEQLGNGRTLTSILREDGMPVKSTIWKWKTDNPDFSNQYAQARLEQAHSMVDDALDISDDGHNDTYVDDNGKRITDYDNVQRSRLRVDTRKWVATKIAPKLYGEKIEQTLQNPDGSNIVTNLEITFRKPNDN